MFTGIIESIGIITSIKHAGAGKRFTIDAGATFLEQTKIGDSIAVSGACLTVVAINGKYFEADVSPETLLKTTFGSANIGEQTNLERALRFSDRIDGHLVSGHIDGVGVIKQKKKSGNAIIIVIDIPVSCLRYIITKGSIAVDGISLTINKIDRTSFEASVIPHTAKLTTISYKNVGNYVNIETDMIGKYVERFTASILKSGGNHKDRQVMDMQFLAENDFL